MLAFKLTSHQKRALMVDGGIQYGNGCLQGLRLRVDPEIVDFTIVARLITLAFLMSTPRTCVNAVTPIITGLPDAYGRSRIIGDYRRVALYSVDALIADKTNQKNGLAPSWTKTIRHRKELSRQIRALKELKQLVSYGFYLSPPCQGTSGCW